VGATVARRAGAATGALLVAGLLYGLVYGGVIEARTAEGHRAFESAAEKLAPLARGGVPLVVREGTDRRFTYPLVHRLGRLAVERAPEGPYDVVGVAADAPSDVRLVSECRGFALWRSD
jgi:hypothetical protein